jgi:hypothetical protein
MEANNEWKNLKSVRVFRLLIVSMFAIYGLGGGAYGVFATPEILGGWPGQSSAERIMGLSRLFQNILVFLLYLVILYHLYRLLAVISRGHPFSGESPRRIRWAGYGMLAITAVNLAADVARSFALPGLAWKSFFSQILGQGFQTILLGVGLLVIAAVFEAGVKMRQDQDLTV